MKSFFILFSFEFFVAASDNIMRPENMDKLLLEPNLSTDDVIISFFILFFEFIFSISFRLIQ